ncbi:MAG: hypothetical protein ACJ8GW_10210 [Massilia sp.]
MKLENSIRLMGIAKFLGWTAIACIGWYVYYRISSYGNMAAIGGGIAIIGAPGALALLALAEMLTGIKAAELGRRLNALDLPPWQQNVLWLIVFFAGIAILIAGMVLFGG